MSNNMEYLLIPQNGDHTTVKADVDEFDRLGNQELIDHYNSMAELGLVGARRQSLRVFAIGVVFKRRFGESPVTLKDNVILGMRGQIRMDGTSFSYLKPENDAQRSIDHPMRKYHKSFHCIGSVDSDPCPGLSDSWDVFIARTRDGRFFACQSEGETDFEIGDAREAAEWILTESGVDDLGGIIDAIGGIRGFKKIISHLGLDDDE